jgi:hypothetical protein
MGNVHLKPYQGKDQSPVKFWALVVVVVDLVVDLVVVLVVVVVVLVVVAVIVLVVVVLESFELCY